MYYICFDAARSMIFLMRMVIYDTTVSSDPSRIKWSGLKFTFLSFHLFLLFLARNNNDSLSLLSDTLMKIQYVELAEGNGE